ncbi:unnamed protein product [Cylindrotheca closterium]|uniref:Uncharacterized protein n=1 Tax=Cylindrotheca closterium TaxID=2856 RepID=A0AAD2FHA3_9STRA|nr:unnamed protein product [Cylindrotheca closterium]
MSEPRKLDSKPRDLSSQEKCKEWARIEPALIRLWGIGAIGPNTKFSDVMRAPGVVLGKLAQQTFQFFWNKLRTHLIDKQEQKRRVSSSGFLPSTRASKRSKSIRHGEKNGDHNMFHPVTNFVPYIDTNGDKMLAVVILLPSGVCEDDKSPFPFKAGYRLELDHDVLRLTVKMPELFEDFENLFYAVIEKDECTRWAIRDAHRRSMMKYRKDWNGSIALTAEIHLPSKPVRNTFRCSQVKQKATSANFLVFYFTMEQFDDGTCKFDKPHEC